MLPWLLLCPSFFSQGGFQNVRDGLEAMAKRNGASIRLNTAVQRILLEDCEKESSSDKTIARAVGVELADGERLFADVVVANPDIPYAYDKLLQDGGEPIAKEAERIAKWDYRRAFSRGGFAVSSPRCRPAGLGGEGWLSVLTPRRVPPLCTRQRERHHALLGAQGGAEEHSPPHRLPGNRHGGACCRLGRCCAEPLLS